MSLNAAGVVQREEGGSEEGARDADHLPGFPGVYLTVYKKSFNSDSRRCSTGDAWVM